LQGAIARASGAWAAAAQEEFRRIVVDRVRAYQREGLRGLGRFHDKPDAVDPHAAFTPLIDAAPALKDGLPALAAFIKDAPVAASPQGSSEHVFWMVANQTPKPMLQVLHVTVFRSGQSADSPEVLVVSKQVFATHYLNASVHYAALVRDPEDASVRYLVYVHRSTSDGMGGFLAGLKRFFVERRIRGAARTAFEMLKGRLEQPAGTRAALGSP
jgi:hypothetical protein